MRRIYICTCVCVFTAECGCLSLCGSALPPPNTVSGYCVWTCVHIYIHIYLMVDSKCDWCAIWLSSRCRLLSRCCTAPLTLITHRPVLWHAHVCMCAPISATISAWSITLDSSVSCLIDFIIYFMLHWQFFFLIFLFLDSVFVACSQPQATIDKYLAIFKWQIILWGEKI